MNQPAPTLFDPATTLKPVCPACGTGARSLCRHDADIHHGLKDALSHRPKGCLNSAQNRDGVPY